MFSLNLGLTHQSLQLIVEHEHQSTTSTTQDVGEGALEEGRSTFLLANLDPAIESVLVHDVGLGTARLHHHASSDGVEWIGDDAGSRRHNLQWNRRKERGEFSQENGMLNCLFSLRLHCRLKIAQTEYNQPA